MIVAELLVYITARSEQFIRETTRSSNALKGLDSTVASVSSSVAVGIGLAGIAMTALGGVAIKMAADFEQTEVAFNTLLGNAKETKKFLADLAKFASTTPFELKDLQKSSRQLLAFGFQAKEIIPMMTNIGDAVGALGGGAEQIDRVVTAIGQIKAKGKLSTEELMQMAEVGIPVFKILQDTFKMTGAELESSLRKGSIGADQAITALLNGMNAKFKGAMNDQSKTINGIFSNIKDATGQLMITIGQELIKALNFQSIIKGVQDFMNAWQDMAKTIGSLQALQKLIPPEIEPSLVAIGGIILGLLIPAVLLLGTAVGKLTVKMAPWLALGLLIAGTAYLLYKNWAILITFFISTLPNAIATFAKSAIMWFSQLPAKLDTFISQIPTMIAYGLGYALGFVIKFMNDIVTGIEKEWNALPGQLKITWNNIKWSFIDGWRSMVEWGKNLIKGFRSDSSQTFGEMVPDIKTVFENILSYLSGLKDRFVAKATEIAGGFWSGFKAGLGIQSPSYVERAFMDMSAQSYATARDIAKNTKFMSQYQANAMNNIPQLGSFNNTGLYTSGNQIAKATVPTTTQGDMTNNLEQQEISPAPIVVQNMYVRNDDDIKAIAQELYKLQLNRRRGTGERVTI